MASSTFEVEVLSLQLAPGPLGVIVQRTANGSCKVTSKKNGNSPLQINDVIVLLNGIKLANVQGGVEAWVKLFQAFDRRCVTIERPKVVTPPPLPPLAVAAETVVVPEPVASSAIVPQTALSSAKVGAPQTLQPPLPSVGASNAATKAPHPPQPVSSSAVVLSGAAGSGKSALAVMNSCDTCTPTRKCGFCITREKIQRGTVPKKVDVAKKKHKLKPSTKHNAAKKQKVATAKKPSQAATKNASAPAKMAPMASTTKPIMAIAIKQSRDQKLGLCLVQIAEKTLLKVTEVLPSSLFVHTALRAGMVIRCINGVRYYSGDEGLAMLSGAVGHLMIEAGYPSPPAVATTTLIHSRAPSAKRKDDFNHDDHYMKMMEEGFPERGHVSPCMNYYITEFKGETYRSIAEKVGLEDWKQLNEIQFNKKFYGVITANRTFLENTIIKIPKLLCSKWKLNKLIDNHVEEVKSMGKCTKCLKMEQPGDTDEMLICDGCDALVHTSCAGLFAVPKGDWLCEGCLSVLAARRHAQNQPCIRDQAGRRSLEAALPPPPAFDAVTTTFANHAEHRFRIVVTDRRNHAFHRLTENHRALANATKERIETLESDIINATRQMGRSEHVASLKGELEELVEEEKARPQMESEDKDNLLLAYAKLLSEPRLSFETNASFNSRYGFSPVFMGVVTLEAPDIQALNVLREPTELVIAIPVDPATNSNAGTIEVGLEYYLFGAAELFSRSRNDDANMDFSPTSERTAQRDLMAMLRRDPRNQPFTVTEAHVPTSVSLRGTSEETLGEVVKCFDLSELVRDCHYPIENMPAAETPKLLADNGLVLRHYQKTSLQFLLDKENNPTGMGSSGELWARMRGVRRGRSVTYFYCELTGSIVNEIFDYRSDVGQGDASEPFGDSFPSAAIIGSEMGLGKTVIALALVVASPPKPENRILPREHIAKINHPAYLSPPKASSNTPFISNGTLVIAPMTLCPQWQSEIERFAPWMKLVTLHNDETESAEEIASKDIVVVSTFMMSQPTGKAGAIKKKLQQIHFHRVFLDESHYNNTGERVKLSLAQLSATHRYCVTGTPVGQSLADLWGQLRFLRVPQFCRPDFWSNAIDGPYSDHNCYALNVLRSLLSRIVIRHSKEQVNDDGDALVSLPPRNVETLLLPFGSDAEKAVYQYIEERNTKRFMELRSVSPSSVLGKFFDLKGMLHAARSACGHPSLVNLDSLQSLNEKLERERHFKLGYGRFEESSTKTKKSTSRADVYKEAVTKARSSAQGRMREIVLQLHEGEVDMIECPVCLEATSERDIALTPCAHSFCSECILSCMKSLGSREPSGACPECRELVLRSELTFLGDAKEAGESGNSTIGQKPKAAENTESNIDINGFHLSTKDTLAAASSAAGDRRVVYQPLSDSEKRQQRAFCHTLTPQFLTAWDTGYNIIGTKIACLLEQLKSLQKDPTSKAVVFSQFLGTLDLAQQEITARGINCVRVDGTTKQYQRADAIASFTQDPSTRVLLLSMRAGAAGLNLMAANYCFLMDPTENTAYEEQAIDRIHRIGQTRPVFVKRLIIKDSIEERILENRRSLAADRPIGSTAQVGGSSLLEEDDGEQQTKKKRRDRHEDECDMGEQSFQRLRGLEALFGCSATLKVAKA